MSMNLVKYEVKNKDIYFRDNRSGKGKLRCLPHLHRELELVCMLEGETVTYVDSVRDVLRSGDVFLTFPNQIHFYESNQTEKYYIFIIKPDLMPDLMGIFTSGVPSSAIIRGAANQPQIRGLFDSLAELCSPSSSDSDFTATRRRGYLLALFSELLSQMTVTRLSVGDSGALRSIVAFCEKNFSENLSLSLLEEKLHLNKYYISHLFSEKLGLRFNDYVNSLRVSEACRYLVGSDYSITEISEIVGFNTLRTFNRAFMKQMGMSPSEYRKNDGAAVQSTKDTLPAQPSSSIPACRPVTPVPMPSCESADPCAYDDDSCAYDEDLCSCTDSHVDSCAYDDDEDPCAF
ncbi:MAG: AraC family transcriptional regulator [Clostridia bacterium]|nr:AraC family transcriptional regulator [Clostridia bacterium]